MNNNTVTPRANGLGGVLTTLASSGDNWVKLLIVGGIILNTVWTGKNGNGIKENNKELDQLRKQVAFQVDAIFRNQQTYIDLWDEERTDHVRVMKALGIQMPDRPPIPRVELGNLPPYGPYPQR